MMALYECHVCRENFESDYRGGRQTPKYCPDCKGFAENDKAVVYGLHAGDGVIHYVGSTINPVGRLTNHRSPDSYRDAQPRLARWVDIVGPDNLRMEILRIVPADDARAQEERELVDRRHENLLNERSAAVNIYTEEEIMGFLSRMKE